MALDSKTEVIGEMMRELTALRLRDDEMMREGQEEIKRKLELMKTIDVSLRTMIWFHYIMICESQDYGSSNIYYIMDNAIDFYKIVIENPNLFM